ncbi:hypothetical protein GW17_00052150 [Ensete ventricosum]|nr:hypothetical protein GW17_00052150 [Ensete ventricosum]RZS19557.1 hypothetical protein BHM03_00051969 [Ensete ventricosum]
MQFSSNAGGNANRTSRTRHGAPIRGVDRPILDTEFKNASTAADAESERARFPTLVVSGLLRRPHVGPQDSYHQSSHGWTEVVKEKCLSAHAVGAHAIYCSPSCQ